MSHKLEESTTAQVGTSVVVDREAQEAWAELLMKSKMAALVLHYLASKKGQSNAVVISQKTLSEVLEVSQKTIQRAIATLVAEHWISAVQLNGAGTFSAYILNDATVWGEVSENKGLSLFEATVIADKADQNPETLAGGQLRTIPTLFLGRASLR